MFFILRKKDQNIWIEQQMWWFGFSLPNFTFFTLQVCWCYPINNFQQLTWRCLIATHKNAQNNAKWGNKLESSCKTSAAVCCGLISIGREPKQQSGGTCERGMTLAVLWFLIKGQISTNCINLTWTYTSPPLRKSPRIHAMSSLSSSLLPHT